MYCKGKIVVLEIKMYHWIVKSNITYNLHAKHIQM